MRVQPRRLLRWLRSRWMRRPAMKGHEGRLVTSDERPQEWAAHRAAYDLNDYRAFRAECECGYVGPWATTNAAMGSHRRHVAALRDKAKREEFPAVGATDVGRGELAGGDVQAVRFEKKRRRPTKHDQRTPLPGDPDYAPRTDAATLKQWIEEANRGR